MSLGALRAKLILLLVSTALVTLLPEGLARILYGKKLDETLISQIINLGQLGHDLTMCKQGHLQFETSGKNIFSFGGSSVAGYNIDPKSTFPQAMNRIFEKRRRLDLHSYNLGASGKDSSFVRKCAESVTKNFPAEYFIVYSGHNDFINKMPNPAQRHLLEENQALMQGLLFVLKESVLAAWFIRPFMTAKPAPLTEQLFAYKKQTILNQYKSNMQALINNAKSHGITVIFSTVVSRLHDQPPHDYFPVESDRNAAKLYERGMNAYRRGHYEKSKQLLIRARDLDLRGWRAYSELNDTIRSLVKENPGTYLMDFERVLLSSDNYFGCNYFGNKSYCDYLHPNERTHFMLAIELAQLILKIEETPSFAQLPIEN